MDTFRPAVGVSVFDGLNERWITLDEEMVAHMEKHASGRGARERYADWDGFMLEGWVPADKCP